MAKKNSLGVYGPEPAINAYFNPAKNTLEEMIKLFRQGGGYGAGQNAIIDAQANQAQAKAASDAVASGMSSGSLATSTGTRIASDTAKAKLGVEDTRTNFLAQAMQALSSLYGQFGGIASQERMQTEALKKQSAIADMNAAVSLMGRQTSNQGAGGGMSGWDNNWGQPALGSSSDSQGYNQPNFGSQWNQPEGGGYASLAPTDYAGYQISRAGAPWQAYTPDKLWE
jgi:hypothetical protein